MITIERDKDDDRPKKRILLTIGDHRFHLSDAEAVALRNKLNQFKLPGRGGKRWKKV